MRIILLLLFSFSLVCIAQAELTHDMEVNTSNEIAVPKKTYRLLYTINSSSAILKKDNQNNFQLILSGVFKEVGYKNKFILVTNFINDWNSFSFKKSARADITGVQVNKNTIGHTQFYASVELKDPVYNLEKNELKFLHVKLLTKINIKDYAKFDNTTIFINGCDLYHCGN